MDHQFEIVTDSTCDLPVEELAKQRVLAAASAQKAAVNRLGCVHGAP